MSRALFENRDTGEQLERSGILGAALRYGLEWEVLQEDPDETVGDGLPAGCVPPSEDGDEG